MKLFKEYLRGRRGPIGLFFALALLLTASFALYRLPLKAVLYPLGLCFLIACGFFFAGYAKVKKRHGALVTLRNSMAASPDAELLPPADTVTEADYRELIRLLIERERRLTDEAVKSRGAMIDYYTVWAHQVKTPIASMRLTLQNEDSDLSRKLQNDLSRIERYADMVMTYLRLDTAATDHVIRECDLDGIVRPAVRKFAGEFIAKKLKLTYTPLDTTVLTDEKWLAFAVEQIISNAVKYTPEGGVSICLEAPKTLCIRDTGIGIAPEDLPRIFENGFTGLNGRADKRASGIGLYLCKRVCDRLGHRIRIESSPGSGTAVRIDLDAKEICSDQM